MTALSNAIAAMRKDPKEFLRQYWVTIAGAGPGDLSPNSGLATFDFNMPAGTSIKGFTTGKSGKKGVLKDRPQITFTKVPGVALADNLCGPNQFNAWYIAMTQINDPTAHFALSTTAGPNIVLTSMLSGCTFGVGSEATGCQLISHVQPPRPSSGLTRTDLHDFSVDGLTSGINGIFERESDPDYGGNATIIGVRHGTKWKFYVQSYGNDPTDSGYFAINASKRFA